jgi:hypothetical protein
MSVIKLDPKLCARESFDNGTVYGNLFFFFSHNTSLTWLLTDRLPESSSNSLLIIHTALLALGNEPAFTSHGAEHTTLYHLLAKAFE